MRLTGYLVADARGRVLGRVECPIYGASPEIPDALAVRVSVLGRRRCLVPADAIEAIDDRTRVIGLRIERSALVQRHDVADASPHEED
jgi:hypothetical protein